MSPVVPGAWPGLNGAVAGARRLRPPSTPLTLPESQFRRQFSRREKKRRKVGNSYSHGRTGRSNKDYLREVGVGGVELNFQQVPTEISVENVKVSPLFFVVR